MWVNPFWLGFGAGILVTLIVLVVWALLSQK